MIDMKMIGISVGLVSAIAGCQSPGPRPAAGSSAPMATTAPVAVEDRRQPSALRLRLDEGRAAPVGNDATSPGSETQSMHRAAPESVQPPTGHACRVFLRRDALGMAGSAPLAPNLDAPLQRGTVVSGTLDQVTESWIVLKSDAGWIWIPRNAVLMIEVTDR